MSLNYVMIGSNDVPKARGFYDKLFPAIGGRLVAEYMPHAFCYQFRDGSQAWVASPYNREAAAPGNGNMVGLLCASKDEVDAAHAIALENGATDEGAPGSRPIYGPEFYGGYLRDLDGNKMSLVYLG